MKTRILAGCGMLLTLGTAMAGTWIYGQNQVAADEAIHTAAPVQQATPEMIAIWRVTAVTADYVAPRVPL